MGAGPLDENSAKQQVCRHEAQTILSMTLPQNKNRPRHGQEILGGGSR
jgi:hypothetical protein